MPFCSLLYTVVVNSCYCLPTMLCWCSGHCHTSQCVPYIRDSCCTQRVPQHNKQCHGLSNPWTQHKLPYEKTAEGLSTWHWQLYSNNAVFKIKISAVKETECHKSATYSYCKRYKANTEFHEWKSVPTTTLGDQYNDVMVFYASLSDLIMQSNLHSISTMALSGNNSCS